jgi:2',3'-cyclic-nucleotide 2'-phosphodiesterase (5'-nucleotidase family)
MPCRAVQQQKAPFYFLNAGDEFLGTLWDQLYKGQATAQVQRAIGTVRPNVQVLVK